jgi:cell division protein FtsX
MVLTHSHGGNMNQAQHLPNQEKCPVEVVVYVSKDLGDEQQNLVVNALEKTNGIIGAEFCQTRNHLVLAQYDKNVMSSQDVLKSFNSLNLDARLIGPI